jgi:hypothetical protein
VLNFEGKDIPNGKPIPSSFPEKRLKQLKAAGLIGKLVVAEKTDPSDVIAGLRKEISALKADNDKLEKALKESETALKEALKEKK